MPAINLPWLRKYTKAFELGFETALEYRINFMISLISAAYPIIIQTFLWSAIFKGSAQDTLYGYTFRQMMVYTFLAGLIGRIIRTGFEYEIMEDVKSGRFSRFLVQPVGYFPYRLASFYGQKAPSLTIILIILALVLAGLSFYWSISLEFTRILAFLLTLALAVTLNFMIFYCFSAVSFWIVEIGFLFEGIRIVTILLSGGIFPLEVFGQRFVQITALLPFKYTINYPINVLNGKLSGPEIAQGMLIQLAWIALSMLVANMLWKIGSRRFVAVGG